jgi:hypothetical protein
MMKNASWLLLPIAAIAIVAPAQAAETGNIRGRVVDEQGGPVPGATVTVSGANIAGEVTTTTAADGSFQIIALRPGVHEVHVSMANFAPAQIGVQVRLDESAYVPVTLRMAGAASEAMVVEETLPVIDTTRSTFSTEVTSEQLENLPLGRSYQDAVNMLPGVHGRVNTQEGGPSDGNPSVRGEGQYGNNYLVDGISTRDPSTKTFGTNVNFDAIQSIQTYTDGAPAEFGQATGMLVNVVTKSGGDEHHGSVGAYASMDACFADPADPVADLPDSCKYNVLNIDSGEEEPAAKQSYNRYEVSATAGGPIVKEKLWYFIALDGQLDNTFYEAMDPDHPYDRQDGQGFVKLTWFPSSDFTLQGQLTASGTWIDNYETNGLYSPEAQSQYKATDLTPILTGLYHPDAKTEIQLKLSYLTSAIDVVPIGGSRDAASFVNQDTGQHTGNYDDFDYNDRSRTGGSLQATRVIDRFAGSHRWKVGVEGWVLKDARELIYTGPSGTIDYIDPNTGKPGTDNYDGIQYFTADGFPCDQEVPGAPNANCEGFQTYSNVGEPLGHTGNIMTGFIQDDWNPVDPLTLNLGFRIDREVLYQNEDEKVVDSWMPVPRLGLAWDITNDSKTALTANAGRYYDLSGNSFADWGDTRSAYVYKTYENDGKGNYNATNIQDPEVNPLVYCTDDDLNSYKQSLLDGGVKEQAAEDEVALARKYCGEKGLKPYHLDKLTIGFQREIVPLLAAGVRGIISKTTDIPEDVDINYDTWVIANPEEKYRDYKALEFTLERKYDKRWSALVSWTMSESKGTMPGQFELSSGGQTGSNGDEVGVFLDDVADMQKRQEWYDGGNGWILDLLYGLGRAGSYDANGKYTEGDDAGYYGYLPYHSFHSVKANGFYTFDFGTTVGMVYEFDSGHAWQKRGLVDGYGDYFAFPEGRGSRFMPSAHYIDIRVAHQIDFTSNQSLEIMLDMFNVPDLDTPITYYENDNSSFGKTLYRQSPRAFRLGLKYSY